MSKPTEKDFVTLCILFIEHYDVGFECSLLTFTYPLCNITKMSNRSHWYAVYNQTQGHKKINVCLQSYRDGIIISLVLL